MAVDEVDWLQVANLLLEILDKRSSKFISLFCLHLFVWLVFREVMDYCYFYCQTALIFLCVMRIYTWLEKQIGPLEYLLLSFGRELSHTAV